jgi:Rrf2 family iron-sulfur cluster assembly transcriptional regulator
MEMLINTKSKIAVISMINLAKYSKNAPVSLLELSRRQKMSASYLEQVFSKLKKAGLVKSSRGPGGGYQLPNLDISVAQIVDAVKVKEPSCGEGWTFVSMRVRNELDDIKLSDLLL